MTLDLFREIEKAQHELETVFKGLNFGQLWGTELSPHLTAKNDPLINLSEDEENYYFEALVPGIDPPNIHVGILKETLTIEGERKTTNEGRTYHRQERSGGKFQRSITLPSEVDSENIEAKYQNGILSMTLPKAKETQPQKVEIKIG